MNEGLNNIFAWYAPKSRTYSTTMNLKNCILLSIYFHCCNYQYFFTKMCSCIGFHISESLSIQINRMNIRRQYDRVYKKNTHTEMLRDHMLQQTLGTRTSSKPRIEWKAHFMEAVLFLTLSLNENKKLGQQIWKSLLKYVVRLNTRLPHHRIVTGPFIKKRYQNKLFFPWLVVSFNIYNTSTITQNTVGGMSRVKLIFCQVLRSLYKISLF